MKMKKLGGILLLLVGLCSCGNNKEEFFIEGTINNLGGRALYALYETDNNLVIDTLLPNNGYISLRNSSEVLIPIQFYYADKTPFTKIYVKNGDRIKLSGDGEEPFGLIIEGSSINKRLFEFNQTNRTILQSWLTERNKTQSGLKNKPYDEAFQKLQAVIIDYVSHRPNDPVSAILVGDYLLGESDKALCDSLIGLFSEELLATPPASPILQYRQYQDTLTTDSILPKFQWVTPTDTIDDLDTRKAIATLLCFLSSDHAGTMRHYQSFMKTWSEKYSPDTLQLLEISLDRDSAVWKESVKSDTVKWERRWLQDNFLASGIKQLYIQQVPYLIVTDSLGKIISRGLPPDSMDSYIKQIIYPDSIHSLNRK